MDTYDNEPKTSNINCTPDILNSQHPTNPTCTYMSRDIIILDNVFSADECTQIKQLSNQIKLASNSTTTRHKYCFNFQELSTAITQRCEKYIPLSAYIPPDDDISSPTTSRMNHHNDEDHWYYTQANKAWRLVKCEPNSKTSLHLDSPCVYDVNNKSMYTIMVYLTDNEDGETSFGCVKCIPKKGRVLIFRQSLAHDGYVNSKDKWFIRSELMYKRGKSVATSNDKKAINLYNQAIDIHKTDPTKAKQLESEAFDLSPILEKLITML